MEPDQSVRLHSDLLKQFLHFKFLIFNSKDEWIYPIRLFLRILRHLLKWSVISYFSHLLRVIK